MKSSVLITAICITLIDASPNCAKNEVYSECGNNGCQNTCTNPNIAPVCRGTCQSGCICEEGYLRNTKGVCVPSVQCDTCKENEVFVVCQHTCQNTCAKPDLKSTCHEELCRAGCACKDGLVRNENDDCVKQEECENGCEGDTNAERTFCGTPCPVTCDNRDEGFGCITVCEENVCRCKEGYILGPEGKCILEKDCPVKGASQNDGKI